MTLLGGLATVSLTAGCLGDDVDPIEGNADEYLLSASRISDILPEDWEFFDTRPPGIDPVGLESVEIHVLVGPTFDDILDYGIALFDDIDNAETFYDDTYSSTDDPQDEDIGEEGFSISDGDITGVSFRYANAWVQIAGTPHISYIREVANEQLQELED